MLEKIEPNLRFEKLEAGKKQYTQEEMNRSMVVNAKYVRDPKGGNNPNICALPPMDDMFSFVENYGDQKSEVKSTAANVLSENELLDLISMQSFSIPLWYYPRAAQRIRDLLVKSYSCRALYTRSSPEGDGDQVEAYLRRELERPDFGLLVGPSGCGKTHLIRSICKMYPQVIRHDLPEITFHQIPILLVTTVVRSLSGLLNEIAATLDEMLDAGDFHATKMAGCRDMGRKIPLLERWIREYAIGLIIIDEAQFLNFGSVKEGESGSRSSIENIVTVSEHTGVGIMLVGNPELEEKVAGFGRMISRLKWNRMNVDNMGENDRQFFSLEIGVMWKQLYIKNRPVLTDEMTEALALDCAYNVCVLCTILKELQFRSAKGAIITDEYIKRLGSESMIEELRFVLRVGGEETEKLIKKRFAAVNEKINEAKAAAENKETQESLAAFTRNAEEKKANEIRERVLEEVRRTTKAPIQDIEEAFKLAYKENPLKIARMTVDDVVKDVKKSLVYLYKKAEKKASRTSKPRTVIELGEEGKSAVKELVNSPFKTGGAESA